MLRYGREIAQVWEDADVAAQGLMYGCQQPHVQPHVWDVMCSLMYVSKHKASCMGGCCSTRPQVWEDVAAQGLRYGSMLLLQHKASAQGLMYGSQHKASCMGGCCSTRPQVWEDAAARGLMYGRMLLLQHKASGMGACCCCSTRPVDTHPQQKTSKQAQSKVTQHATKSMQIVTENNSTTIQK